MKLTIKKDNLIRVIREEATRVLKESGEYNTARGTTDLIISTLKALDRYPGDMCPDAHDSLQQLHAKGLGAETIRLMADIENAMCPLNLKPVSSIGVRDDAAALRIIGSNVATVMKHIQADVEGELNQAMVRVASTNKGTVRDPNEKKMGRLPGS
jgi:hypothetical protein